MADADSPLRPGQRLRLAVTVTLSPQWLLAPTDDERLIEAAMRMLLDVKAAALARLIEEQFNEIPIGALGSALDT